jgi:hypothetical protein
MEQTPQTGGQQRRDDLADLLIEKRERLGYFIVTGSTAILAFTVASLKDSIEGLGAITRIALIVGGLLLLAAAGLALFAIRQRHRVYADYLDEIQGITPKMPEAKKHSIRIIPALLEPWTIGVFYLGVVVLVVVNTIALFRP